jgi:fumarate reductase flavoprotein subunit
MNGKRFMAEVMESNGYRAMLFQPNGLAFAVFDSDSLEHFTNTVSPIWGGPQKTESMIADEIARQSGIKERLKEENDLGTSKIASTMEEIAEYIGADPEVLKTEVERFNSFCDNGTDEDYYKEPQYLRPVRKPPFYAMRCNIFHQCTHGGIVINDNMEVMGKNGTAIQGLYATGDHTSGWCSEFGWVGSTSLAWALISGYMAAESACEYMKSTD